MRSAEIALTVGRCLIDTIVEKYLQSKAKHLLLTYRLTQRIHTKEIKMKLGTQTNSLTNHLYSRMTIGAPEAAKGMSATILGWSDRHAATVQGVERTSSGKVIVTITRDKKTLVKAAACIGEQPEYAFESDPEGSPYHFRQEADGKWEEIQKNKETGRWIKTKGYGLILGKREEYRDPTF